MIKYENIEISGNELWKMEIDFGILTIYIWVRSGYNNSAEESAYDRELGFRLHPRHAPH